MQSSTSSHDDETTTVVSPMTPDQLPSAPTYHVEPQIDSIQEAESLPDRPSTAATALPELRQQFEHLKETTKNEIERLEKKVKRLKEKRDNDRERIQDLDRKLDHLQRQRTKSISAVSALAASSTTNQMSLIQAKNDVELGKIDQPRQEAVDATVDHHKHHVPPPAGSEDDHSVELHAKHSAHKHDHTAPPERPALTPKQRWLIVFGMSLGMLMAALDNTIVGTALPKIVSELGGSSDEYSWVVISYLLTSTALMPSYGRLSDIFGRRATYLTLMVVFMIGSALCGASYNMAMLIGSRALQGVGGGGLMGLSFIILGDIASPRERGKFAGMMGGMFALSSVGGPFIGGLFTDHASWRWCFYVNLPLGVLAFVMVFVVFRHYNVKYAGENARIDFTGTILISVVTVLLLLGISWGGGKYAWNDPIIIILMVIGSVLVIPFGFSQRDVPLPIMPLRLFTVRNVLLPSLAAFFMGWIMFACFIFLPVWFQEVHGHSATNSGLQMLPLMLGLIIASMVSGAIVTKTGFYKWFPVIGGVLLTTGVFLLFLFDQESGQGQFIPILLLIGLGIGLSIQVLQLTAQNVVAQHDIAVATTIVNFLRTMGGSFGVAVFTAMITNISTSVSNDIMSNPQNYAWLFTPMPDQDAIRKYVLTEATRYSFLYTGPMAVAVILFALFVKPIPLRQTLEATPAE